MSDSRTSQVQQPHGEAVLTPTGARQGLTGMGVRYVLAISLIGAVVGFAVAYLVFFGF